MKKWEPKQEEYVRYDHDVDGQCYSFVGRYVTTYNEKYLVNDNGKFLLVESIEPILPQNQEQSAKPVIGSVWERDMELWVITRIHKNGNASFYCPETTDACDSSHSGLFEPRPDKIGVAPCLRRLEVRPNGSHFSSYEWLISDQVFRCKQDAGIYCDSEKFIWPANNSMWVIVNKE